MTKYNFSDCFVRYQETLGRLSSGGVEVRSMIGVWSLFFLIAVFGSLLYGASLSLVFPGLELQKGALLILLSAGLGWFVFGPLLLVATRLPLLLCAHACMVTMAYGELVLAFGALGNLSLWLLSWQELLATSWNILALLVGNLTMAAVLALQLKALGVPSWKTLLCWVIGLNGSGALFFWLFSWIL